MTAATTLPDDPALHAEFEAAFDRYEDALVNNRVEVLDELFFDSPMTLRYGAGENLVGTGEIRAYRASRPAAGLAREITSRHLTLWTREAASANVTFRRPGDARIGRQSQQWIRFEGLGWRVVSAHVSWMAG